MRTTVTVADTPDSLNPTQLDLNGYRDQVFVTGTTGALNVNWIDQINTVTLGGGSGITT